MSWISTGRATPYAGATARSYGAIGDGNSHPLSSAYPGITLGAAQAAFPNAAVTALTQEVDTCAILQLFHDYAFNRTRIEGGTYVIDQLLLHQGGLLEGDVGTTLQAKAGSALTAVIAYTQGGTHVRDITVDAHQYTASYSLLRQGSGATHGHWFRNCANSLFTNIAANNAAGFGFWFDTSTGGISDGILLDNPAANTCGTLEIQSLVSTATSGTFTITVTNYLGTQTTGAIAFNAPAATVLAALNALTTVSPAGDQTGSAYTAQTAGLPGNTNGPLATNPLYIIHKGPLNGPQSLFTINTGGLVGGTVTCTRIQAGIIGGGFGLGGGVDNNIVVMNKPRASTCWGDGIQLAGAFNWAVHGGDIENNWGAGVRFTGAPNGATTGGGASIHNVYTEGNWQSFYTDTLYAAGSTASWLIRTNNGNAGHGQLLRQPGRNYDDEFVFDVGQFVLNGTVLSLP